MNKQYDLIVIGGGILGTFHAYHALNLGLSVAILEQSKQPIGATTQNFGQVVPSGMNTKWQNYGKESLRIYKEIQSQFDISVRQNGSIYLASNSEELQLLEELARINKQNEYSSLLLTKTECLAKYPKLKNNYVIGGLFFPEEITVEPLTMIHKLQNYLVTKKGLHLFTNTKAIHVIQVNEKVEVLTANQKIWKANQVAICNGSDFKTLYPNLFAASDLEVSKLQMLQTKPQNNFTLPGSILTGLSIRRYEAFYECPSFKEIKQRENSNSLEKKWGVHILFKQAIDGSVIIGDSHQYADAKDSDDLNDRLNMDIDAFMIKEAQKIFDLPTYDIQHRWFGKYSQCKTQDVFLKTINDRIHIVTGIGGKGMTASAGFSKEHIHKILS